MADKIDTPFPSVSRRRILQAGVAAGVGAVAWSSPHIRSTRVVAADGLVCTAPFKTLEAKDQEVNCSQQGYVTYLDNSPSAQSVDISGDGLTGTINFGTNTERFSNYQPGCGAPVTFSIDGGGYECFISSVNVVVSGGPGGGTIGSIDPDCAPPVPRTANTCSARIDFTVKCCPTNSVR